MLWRRSSRTDKHTPQHSRDSERHPDADAGRHPSLPSQRLPFARLDLQQSELHSASVEPQAEADLMSKLIGRRIVDPSQLGELADSPRKKSISSPTKRRASTTSLKSKATSSSSLPPSPSPPLPPPPATAPTAHYDPYTPNNDLYLHNSLHSFSFGAPATRPAPSTSLAPDELDTDSHEPLDLTPRPSLVPSSSRSPLYRASREQAPWDYPDDEDATTPAADATQSYDSRSHHPRTSSDVASVRTFGYSSRNASATSVSVSASASASSSSVKAYSTGVTDYESDHPRSHHAFSSGEVEFSSDDDFDDGDIEIFDRVSGVSDEERRRRAEQDWDMAVFGSRDGLPQDPSTGRRGSLPMAIPGAAESPPRPSVSTVSGDEIMSSRRPSRSLDDELGMLSLNRPPNALSSTAPVTELDWKAIGGRQDDNAPQAGPSTHPHAEAQRPSIDLDFDLGGWSSYGKGITTLDFDDVVKGDSLAAPKPRFWTAPGGGGRRPSTATTASALGSDSFTKAVRGWGGERDAEQRRVWSFRKDRADDGGTEGTRDSISSDRTVRTDHRRPRTPLTKDKEKDKDKKAWRGMPVGAEEIWTNEMLGCFKVSRNVAPRRDTTKNDTHFVAVRHFRTEYARYKRPANGPPVNIHKHSRAVAFSINRKYKKKTPAHDAAAFHPTASAHSSRSVVESIARTTPSGAVSVHATAKIMLAPRHVQTMYTSTRTTRQLDAHGLLDDSKPPVPSLSREKSRTHDRSKEAKRHSTPARPTQKAKVHPKAPGSSGGPAKPSSPPGSISTADISRPTLITNPRSSSRGARDRRRPHRSSLDSDEDMPIRTPHAEAFSTMDTTQIDMLRPHLSESKIFARLRRGRSITPGGLGNYSVPYTPHWMQLDQRDSKGPTDQISKSFKTIGLLPETPRERKAAKARKGSRAQGADVDIFEFVPADSLFMLLPLWPSQTDFVSEGDSPRDVEIPNDKRLYLLVYYVAWQEGDPPPGDSKKARGSGEARRDRDDKNVLLSSFRITGRLVFHDELQGSGLRVPDEGLTVFGPLEEALRTMPQASKSRHDPSMTDEFVIGQCSSRDAGVEFYPEGFVRFDLCTVRSEPVPVAIPEDWERKPDEITLTPVGRTVMEMAWLGCIALTSFGSPHE
ncbi:hypothetical protein K523DRAFT_350174 [Schizophyllum commune Tattone D]|nr:hypothetical protein K523DRAFT_350174 [Schizophyllum commune Tattone D]